MSRQAKEPADVAAVRWLFRRWPLPRGRGTLLKVFRRYLRKRTFRLSLGGDLHIAPELEQFGVLWEFTYGPSEAWRLSFSLIEPGDSVIDVGANAGLWTLRAARGAGSAGSVHAFEPDPRNLERIERAAEENGCLWVKAHMQALDRTEGTILFYPGAQNDTGKGRIGPREGSDTPIEVKASSLDALVQAGEVPHPSLIKVDVEGAEFRVFEGAKETLSSKHAPILLFESSGQLAAEMKSSCREVKVLLEKLGYSVFEICNGELRRVPVHTQHRQSDLFAFKPEHLKRVGVSRAFRTLGGQSPWADGRLCTPESGSACHQQAR